MASSEELTAVCLEFQQNFSSLSVRYEALKQEVEAERNGKAKVLRQMEDAERETERLHAQIRSLKQELGDALDYKEKYRAATITVEHLKGRLETARRGVTDAVVEHDQLTEQLRGQIQDLLARIEVSSDAQQMSQLRNQSRELEERAALVTGQLIEERERFAQQQVTHSATIRELHSRNVELEQRYRTMEQEVTQMRSAVRRSMDLQNECAAQREKAVSDAQRAQQDVSALRRQVHDMTEKMAAVQAHHEEDIQRLRAAVDEERAALLSRVAQAVSERNDAVSARDLEEEKHTALQRSVQKRIAAAMHDAAHDIDALQKQRLDDRAEIMQLHGKLRTCELQEAELRKLLCASEARVQQLESEKHTLRSQTEKAVQQEVWLQADRDHTIAQMQVLNTKLEEMSALAKQHEQLVSETDRLKLMLQYKDADVQDARRQLEGVVSQLKATEDACDKRCIAMHKQNKLLKRQLQSEVVKSDHHRKKLMGTLIAKEAALQAALRTLPTKASTVELHTYSNSLSAGLDPIALLMPLNEQAAALEERIAALTRKSPVASA